MQPQTLTNTLDAGFVVITALQKLVTDAYSRFLWHPQSTTKDEDFTLLIEDAYKLIVVLYTELQTIRPTNFTETPLEKVLFILERWLPVWLEHSLIQAKGSQEQLNGKLEALGFKEFLLRDQIMKS